MRPFDLFVSLDALGWTPPHTLQSWLQGGCNGWKPSVQGGFARGVNAGMDVRQFLWLKKEGDQSDGWCLDCAQLTSSMNRCRRFIWRGWFYKLLQVALIKKDPWAQSSCCPGHVWFCFTFLKLQCRNARILGQTYSTKKQPESANSTFSLFHFGVPTKPFIHGLFS